MSNIGLTAAILEAVKRDQGLKTDELHGFDALKVSQRACYMTDKLGSVFRAKLSHRIVRFFDTQERADAWVRNHKPPKKHAKQRGPNQRERLIAETMETNKRIAEQWADLKASNNSGYEVTEADLSKVRMLPGFEGKPRHWVDPASVPMFRYGSGS